MERIINALIDVTKVRRCFDLLVSFLWMVPMLYPHASAANATKHTGSHEVILGMADIARRHLGIEFKLPLCLLPGVMIDNVRVYAIRQFDDILIRKPASVRVFCPEAIDPNTCI